MFLKSSKPSFGWHTQQAVAATTTFSGTSFHYYMCHSSQHHSNFVTTPSSCVLLTLQSVLNQNLTCQSSSSYCRIPMIFDTLKSELKPSFTVDITKGFLLHADKNGSISVKRSCIMVMRMGSTSVERISMEIISIITSSTSLVVVIRTHKRFRIFAFLRFASVLLDQTSTSKIYESLTAKQISNTMLGNFLNTHPCLMVTTR